MAVNLSTQAGWHTSVPLVPASAFTGNHNVTEAKLDLDTLWARAHAAGETIGIQAAQVSVSVAARIVAPGTAVFAPTLQFTLTQLQFGLANGPGSLTVDQTAPAGVTYLVPRQVSILGHHLIAAAEARTWSIRILFVVVIFGIAILLAARRRVPLRNSEEIQRRYPQLLVPVEPVATLPGKPVVDVDDFQALAKLAERYGQLILTWRSGDSKTFIVRDEGITYRHLADADPKPNGKPAQDRVSPAA